MNILDRKNINRMFLTEKFFHFARNCLHHISDRFFEKKEQGNKQTLARRSARSVVRAGATTEYLTDISIENVDCFTALLPSLRLKYLV